MKTILAALMLAIFTASCSDSEWDANNAKARFEREHQQRVSPKRPVDD